MLAKQEKQLRTEQLALANCEAELAAAVCYFLQSGAVGAASGFGSGSIEAGGDAGQDQRLLQALSRDIVGGENADEDISTTHRANDI